MRFQDFCIQHKVTPEEREEIIWVLIQWRIRRMYKSLAKLY